MAREIFLKGKRYIQTTDAAERFGVSRDYISRLCRKHLIDGHLDSRIWYVDAESLQSFIADQDRIRERRRNSLVDDSKDIRARTLERESRGDIDSYLDIFSPSTARSFEPTEIGSVLPHDTLKKYVALVCAFGFIFALCTVFNPQVYRETVAQLSRKQMTIASSVAALADDPSYATNIVSNIPQDTMTALAVFSLKDPLMGNLSRIGNTELGGFSNVANSFTGYSRAK